MLWGADPADSRTYVDGVEIPALYHLGGLRSTLASDMLGAIEVAPGAYPASYGRGLGGLVRVTTRDLPEDAVHGFVAADLLDGSIGMTAASSDRVRVGAAGRYGWLDRIAGDTIRSRAGDYVPIPRYADGLAKASFALRDGERLSIVALASHDDLVRTTGSADPGSARSDETHLGFFRAYAVYERTRADGSRVVVTPFVGRDTDRRSATDGLVPTRLDEDAWVYGVRASQTTPIARGARLTQGIDALARADDLVRVGSMDRPPREGDLYAYGQSPAGDVNADTWSTYELCAAPYAIVDFDTGPFTLSPGARLETFLVEGSRATPRVGRTPEVGFSSLRPYLDPRVAVTWRALPSVAFTAAGGLYHEPPAPEDLSTVFGTPALVPSGAAHVSLGERLRIADAISLETTGFYEHLDHLPVRSRSPEPLLAQALVQDGEGRVVGLQALLRHVSRSGFFGWLSYTVSRSERRYVGDASYRPFDWDEPHIVALVATQTLGAWTFGGRARWASGFPRTPVVGAYFDAHDDVYEPMFGAPGSTRLPDFFELDLRVERAFRFDRVTVRLYLDVLDATDHRNVEEIVYANDYRSHGYLTGLPTLAVAGARVEL